MFQYIWVYKNNQLIPCKMIYETLEIVKDQVSKYLEQKTTDANLVVLENVSKHEDPDINTMNDKVVLSLLNIEEEISLKNNPNIKNDCFSNTKFPYCFFVHEKTLFFGHFNAKNAHFFSDISYFHVRSFFRTFTDVCT